MHLNPADGGIFVFYLAIEAVCVTLSVTSVTRKIGLKHNKTQIYKLGRNLFIKNEIQVSLVTSFKPLSTKVWSN